MTDDLRFAQMMREDASALPPPEKINPWQMAMTQVLWGFGLSTITLNFLYLDYILPALGAVLLVLGFRTLRRENRPLRWCYILSIAKLLVCAAGDVLAALPVKVELPGAYISTAVTLTLYICLWRGMVEVSRAAGAEKPAAPAAGAMALFYALLLPLALIGLQGWLLVLPILIVYAAILRNMWRLTRSLEDMGYAITAAPVRLPGWAVLWGSLAAMLAAVLLTAFLGQRYPMDWHTRSDAPQSVPIRQELLEKGFPERVLNDLTADEVAQLAGAAEVYTESSTRYEKGSYRSYTCDTYYTDMPANWQYDSAKKQEDGAYRYTYRIYDVPKCTVTYVTVMLPGDPGRCMFIQYIDVGGGYMSGFTHGVETWPAWYSQSDQWSRGDYCGGRVLCDRDGQPMAADFCRLENTSVTYDSIFGTSTNNSIIANWSWPRGGENGRAYLMYDAYLLQDEWVYMDSWCNYERQTEIVYPFPDTPILWHSAARDTVDLFQSAMQRYNAESAVPPAQE